MASVSSRLLLLLGLSSLLCPLASSYEVIYAVNCGGGRHTDLNGIKYRKDDIDDGVASDFGKGLTIARVPPEDQILYQTERYHYRDFSYDVPVRSDGNYFVVLKFAEVYFQRPNEKVFGGRGSNYAFGCGLVEGVWLECNLRLGVAKELAFCVPSLSFFSFFFSQGF